MAIGEGLMMIGAGILMVYPIIIALLVDVLVIIAILSAKGESKHPGFLTGFLLGSMFSDRYDYSYRSSPESTYIALAILAPLNAGLAVLLCLHLGMVLPLALMICIGPLGAAFAFITIGAMVKHISFEGAVIDLARGVEQAADNLGQAAKNGLQKVADKTESLWAYLTQQKPALGVGLLLGVSLVVGVALLFHFGLPLYAYAVGFATVGALILLGLGYIAKFAFEAIDNKAGGRVVIDDIEPDPLESEHVNQNKKNHQQSSNPTDPATQPEPGASPDKTKSAEGGRPRSDSNSNIEPGAPQ